MSRRAWLLLGLLMLGCSDKAGGQMSKGFFSDPVQSHLEAAILADDGSAVAQALAAGALANARGKHEVTPLMVAVDAQKPAAVGALLQGGANPNLKAADGASAVSIAVENYRSAPEIMKAVFKAGGDPNMRRPDNDPVIKRFVNDRDCAQIRYLKSVGADLETRTREGDALVIDAAMTADWDVAWCLLELGANPDPPNSRFAMTRILAGKVPSPDSPIYPFKYKVWQYMKDKGFAVQPLAPPAGK